MLYKNFLTGKTEEYTHYQLKFTLSDHTIHYDGVKREHDIQEYMKDVLEHCPHIQSIRLVSEPLGWTEYEYYREKDTIMCNPWSNCD